MLFLLQATGVGCYKLFYCFKKVQRQFDTGGSEVNEMNVYTTMERLRHSSSSLSVTVRLEFTGGGVTAKAYMIHTFPNMFSRCANLYAPCFLLEVKCCSQNKRPCALANGVVHRIPGTLLFVTNDWNCEILHMWKWNGSRSSKSLCLF